MSALRQNYRYNPVRCSKKDESAEQCIQAMHITIKKLYDLMTPEQRTTAFGYSQELRDEFNRIKNIK